jgi:hypothetical protein
VNVINPDHGLRIISGLDLQIDDDRFVIAARNHAFRRVTRRGIYLLMGNVERNVNEVTQSGFRSIFQMLSPTHARLATKDVNYTFQ